MRIISTLVAILCITVYSNRSIAQRMPPPEPEGGGFRAENLFTGGSVSLGFSSNSFQAGLSPFFGYSIAPWVDAGITVNYNYASFRNTFAVNDRIRRSTYGGGAFTRIYPINMIFIQGQFERNFINETYSGATGGQNGKFNTQANSFLVGAGYATGRLPNSGQPFFYFSVLFDILNNEYSPYTRSGGGIMPIIRGGVQVPLFQGKRDRY